MRVLILIFAASLYGQSPIITNVLVDQIGVGSARVTWNSSEVILASTTLDADITASTHTITVVDAGAAGIVAHRVIKIGTERISVGTVATNTITAYAYNAESRGWDYTTAAAHTIGDSVSVVSNDGLVCYKKTGGSVWLEASDVDPGTAPLPKSNNHWVFLGGLDPNSEYTYKVMSHGKGDGVSSNCAVPPPNTGISAEGTFTTLEDSVGNLTPLLPAIAVSVTMPTITGNTYTVDASCTNLQAHINTVVALNNGLNHLIRIPKATICSGNYLLKKKTNNGWTIIRVQEIAGLPDEGVRVDTSYSGALAVVQTRGTSPVFLNDDGANYYRFVGLEIRQDPALALDTHLSLFHMTALPPNGNTASYTADHIILDRSWIHGNDVGASWTCVDIGATYAAVVDSRIENCQTTTGTQQDGGAIHYIKAGPLRIENSYLDAPGITLFVSDNDFVPNSYTSNVTIARNTIRKDLKWYNRSSTFATQVTRSATSATNSNPVLITFNLPHGLGGGYTYSSYGPDPVLNLSGATGGWSGLNGTGLAFTVPNTTLVGSIDTATTTIVVASSASFGAPPFSVRMKYAYDNEEYLWVTNIVGTTWTVLRGHQNTIPSYHQNGARISTSHQVSITAKDSTTWGTFTGQIVTLGYGRYWNVKNTFEFKVCHRCLVEGNIVENSWAQYQNGTLLLISARGPFTTRGWLSKYGSGTGTCADTPGGQCDRSNENITVRNNIFRHGGGWVSLLGNDYLAPSGISRTIKLSNNLVYDLSKDWKATGAAQDTLATCMYGSAVWERYMFDHNTCLAAAAFGGVNGVAEFEQLSASQLRLTNNIFRWGSRGIFEGQIPGNGCELWRDYIKGGHLMAYNAFQGDIRWNGLSPLHWDEFASVRGNWQTADCPVGPPTEFNTNFWPLSPVAVGWVAGDVDTFNQSATYDWALTAGSTYHNAASDGADVGVDMPTLTAALVGSPATPPTISTTTLSSALVLTAVSRLISVIGGTPPYTWTVSSGTLPYGITLNPSTGTLSGTPTVIGPNTFTLQVTDAADLADTQALSWTIDAVTPQIQGGFSFSGGMRLQ